MSDNISKYYHIHDEKLGEGGFAKVRLATHLATRQNVAIKCLDKIKLGPELPRIYNEIECLKRLRHQNIARLYQVFETSTFIYLVLEHCSGGELFDYIVSKSKVSESESAQIIHDLMRVLDFIHINGFAHRDLKPENVLFDDKHHIKLIDFGLAANCSADNMATNKQQAPLNQLTTCCGSVTYAAPEVISGGVYCGTSVDVWSAGVILHALLVGQLPFNDNSIPKLYQKIQAGIQTLPSFLSPEACDLIRRMLTVDPRQRITVRQVLLHPWLRNRANTFAQINRRLNFVQDGQIDEQLLLKCAEKFPHLSVSELRDYIKKDFNYYSTTYYLLQAKCPPRTVAVVSPRRIVSPRKLAVKRTAEGDPKSKYTPKTKYAALSTTPKNKLVTVTNTPQTPRTPPSYLRALHNTRNENSTNIQMSAFIDRPAVKKSIVKRLLKSATPSKMRQRWRRLNL